MSLTKKRIVKGFENRNDLLNIEKVSKETNVDIFEIIKLAAFGDLPVYVFICYEEPDLDFGIPEDIKRGVNLDGFFKLDIKPLKEMLSMRQANSRIDVLISSNGEKFTADLNCFLTINSFSMLYLHKDDFEDLKENSVNISSSPENQDLNIGRREIQLELIQAVIEALDYESLKIPKGGKSAIKKICIKRKRIFTVSGFDHAWKEGLKKNIFRLESHDNYSSKI